MSFTAIHRTVFTMRGSKRTARRSAAVLKRLIQPRPGANLLPKKKKSGRPIAHRKAYVARATDGLERFRIPNQKRLSKRAILRTESKSSGRPVAWYKSRRSSQAIAICGWPAARRSHETALVLHRAMLMFRYLKKCSPWRCATKSFPTRLLRCIANARSRFD